MTQRLSVVLIWFFILWTALVLRGLQMQILPNHHLSTAKEKQYQRIVKLQARRGDVFDRNGIELAISVPAYSLFADPSLVQKPRRLALKLSKTLGVPYKSLYKKLSKKNSRFVWLERLIDESKKSKILEWKEKGLGFHEEFKRVYPNKNGLSHTIGFVGDEGKGLEGIEARYNDYLSSTAESYNLPKDARGRFLVEDGWLFMSKRDGDDLILTVDLDLQFQVEQELKRAIEHHHADGAWAVVMDPKTSEILAMASAPDFDLNQARTTPAARRRNRILSDVYEPGSTIKTIFFAGAMEKKIIEPNTVLDISEGKIEINGRTISESDDDHKYDKLTVAEILAHSSNVGVSKVALRMKDKEIYETFQKFGFTEKVPLDLPGTTRGMLSEPPWRDHLKANISFGHGVALTALHVANAYAAIANGGILNVPYIVKKEDAPEGVRVISKSTANKIKMMLVSATGETATGRRARVKGFPVAGKTGTAQKVDPNGGGYIKGQYISSFVGFLPANDPEYLIYVVIDNPQEKGYYASDTAAPVFARIAEYAINKKGIAPVYVSESDLVKLKRSNDEVAAAATEDIVPNMTGWTLRETLRYLNDKGVNPELVGTQGRVVKTQPTSGEAWTEDKKLKVYME